MKKKVTKRKRRTFNKKDWNEIFNRAIAALLTSMVTQSLKNGVPLKYEAKGFDDRDFLLPGALVTTTHHPKGRTRNPAYDRTGKGKTGGTD